MKHSNGMLLIAMMSGLFLTSCGTGPSETVSLTPQSVSIKNYTKEFQDKAADQVATLEASGGYDETVELIDDYGALRAVLK
jgi:hypothetical protein